MKSPFTAALRGLSFGRGWRRCFLTTGVVFGVLLGAGSAAADTIVLKNGKRIVAFNVVEVGEKIHYETSAGELSLPKSLVDHIEKGGFVTMAGGGSGPGNAANLAITPPAMNASEPSGGEIERAVVHDGAIDRELHREAGRRNTRRIIGYGN